MARVLLHVCCGPCSLMPIQALREEGHEVTAFFFNPNIHPQEEYALRLGAMRQAAAMLDVPLLTHGDAVDPQMWLAALGPERAEGARCRACYRERLKATADMANAQGFDYFSSSLLYSRYQHHDAIIAEAEAAVGEGTGIAGGTGGLLRPVVSVGSVSSASFESSVFLAAFAAYAKPEVPAALAEPEVSAALAEPGDAKDCPAAFLYRDFREYWQQGIEASKEMGLYRQKWCACLLSKGEAEAQRAQRLREKEARRLRQDHA